MESVNVFVKIGQLFTFELPEMFTIENIKFDFTDSIIPHYDDPDQCLVSRFQCWVLNEENQKIDKFSDLPNEEWNIRRIPRTSIFYVVYINKHFL